MSYLHFLHEIINNPALAMNAMRTIKVKTLDLSDQFVYYKTKLLNTYIIRRIILESTRISQSEGLLVQTHLSRLSYKFKHLLLESSTLYIDLWTEIASRKKKYNSKNYNYRYRAYSSFF